MFKNKRIKELEDRIEELTEQYKQQEKRIKTHEQMLIHAAKILRAMDETMGPIYAQYTQQIENKEEDIKNIYG